jgi:hypothetical protein
MKKTALVLLACILLVSCGKKEVKPVSQESKATTEAFAVVETVKNAFIKKDLATIRNNSTDEGYRAITASSKSYDSVDITFTPRWVEIEGNQITVNISWKSSWVLSGRKTEERGMAVFAMEGYPLKVARILRANPFVPPAR